MTSSLAARSVFSAATTAGALLLSSAPAFSASVQFFDDPEVMQVHYLADGRVSFAKDGPYIGPIKGETCATVARKDTKHDRVEPVCKPHFVNVPHGVTAPEIHFPVPPFLWAYDASGYREAHSLSAGLIGEVKATAPTSYALPLATELVALNYKHAEVPPTSGNADGGPVSHVQPPVIPLPASMWLLASALLLLRWRNG